LEIELKKNYFFDIFFIYLEMASRSRIQRKLGPMLQTFLSVIYRFSYSARVFVRLG
jgi:hypothetical protein